jgi:methylaspartate ammonia-lyase
MDVQLVADAWVNSLDDVQNFAGAGTADMIHIRTPDLGSIHNAVEAVLACRDNGVAAFLGGGPGETYQAARATVHIGLATRADLIMAKPGIGVDEAVSFVENEMVRTLMSLGRRTKG